MAGELIAGLSIFKTMFDTARGLKDINDAAIRNAAVIELQSQILAAQTQQSGLVERVSQLEKALARFELWDVEKKRYQLFDFGSGTFAYILKQDSSDGEPSHRLCPNCFQQDKKSILQFEAHSSGQDWYRCIPCKERFAFGVYRSDPIRQPRLHGEFY